MRTVHCADNWADQTNVWKPDEETLHYHFRVLVVFTQKDDGVCLMVPTFLFLILNVTQTSPNLFTWGDILFLPNQWRLGRQR